jgi:hypothetical protein
VRALQNQHGVVVIPLHEPDARARAELCTEALLPSGHSIDPAVVNQLASRFVLPASRISAAVTAALDRHDLETPGELVTREQVFLGARSQSIAASRASREKSALRARGRT